MVLDKHSHRVTQTNVQSLTPSNALPTRRDVSRQR